MIVNIFWVWMTICISSLEKYLFRAFAHLKIRLLGIFRKLLSCRHSLYFLTLTPYQIYGLPIFLPFHVRMWLYYMWTCGIVLREQKQEQIVHAYQAFSRKGSGHLGFYLYMLVEVHAALKPPALSSLEI